MKITEILKKRFTCSVEMLPPKEVLSADKKDSGSKEVLKKVGLLKDVADFYSVTSGAGGSRERCGTISLSHLIEEKYNLECIAHLTCLESAIPDIKERLADISNLKIKNILALKGDPPNDKKTNASHQHKDFKYASDLIGYIVKETKPGYFCIGAAAHPEGYTKDRDLDMETRINNSLEKLKIKKDAGADFAITQMVFDAEVYFSFVKKAGNYGIKIPIIPLVWPVKKLRQCKFAINRFAVTVPFLEQAKQSQDKEKYLFEQMSQLCQELKSGGAPGIHFTIFENEEFVKQIIQYIR